MFTTTIRVSFILIMTVLSMSGILHAEDSKDVQRRSMTTFREKVRPLLTRYCMNCHGAKKHSGNIRFDTINPDIATGSDGETWHDALNKLNVGEMPPEDKPQPNEKEREILRNWITAELKRAYEVRRSTGGRVVIRRLTRYEHANTLRDLLGLDFNFVEELPAEPNSPDKLKNNGSTLPMSPQQIEAYVEIAKRAIAKAIVVSEEPKVFTYKRTVSSGGRGPLHPPNAGTVDLPRYPMEGAFRLKVTASTSGLPKGEGLTMRVVMGVRPSPKNLKTKDVGKVRVTGTQENPQTFEFVGRMENFPLHDPSTAYRERRFSGLKIGFWNENASQTPIGKNRRKKKRPAQLTPTRNEPTLTIHSIEFHAPYYQSWPPKHHTRILFPSSLAKTNEREYARQVLERFMQRAFRREVTTNEVERKLKLYDAYRSQLPSLELAMREVLPVILVSHDFLYLVEPTDGKQQKQILSNHEIASRLSYFLWSSMPDEKLFDLASQNKLTDPKARSAQVRDMLKDKRSWGFVENFTDQWLDLSAINRVAINPEYYPDFDNSLKEEMRQETQHFFAEILRKDLSAMNLLDSDFTMLNRKLAKHYGIEGPADHRFVRVPLEPSDRRGGLLGQASILLTNSTGDDSHPIYRGVFIRDRLLGDTPASPPPDVPNLDKDNPDLQSLSVKQQLELHRKKPACYACHRNIDPWGIPLENYDAVGLWRTQVKRAVGNGEPAVFKNGVRKKKRKLPRFNMVDIESTSTLSNGTNLQGIEELKSYLLKHEQQRFVKAFVRRLFAYSLGRSLELTDNETVESLVSAFKKSGYQIDELIVAITESKPFLTK